MSGALPRIGVMFDLDGMLVENSHVHTLCCWEASRQYGHVVPMAVTHRAVGMGSVKLLDQVLGLGHDTSNDSDITLVHGALVAAWCSRIRSLPGARDLLAACSDLAYTVVLATSAPERGFDALGADDFSNEVTTSTDADESKPRPDILVTALDRANLPAHQVLFVGDEVWDVQASDRLSIRCIGLESGGTSDAELRKAGAVETWKDPEDLLHHIKSAVLDHPLAISQP